MAQIRSYTGRVGGAMEVAIFEASKQGFATMILEAVDRDGLDGQTFVVTARGDAVRGQQVYTPKAFLDAYNPEGRTG